MKNRIMATALASAALVAGWFVLTHPPRADKVLAQMQQLSAPSRVPPAALLVNSNPILTSPPTLPDPDPVVEASGAGATTSAPVVLAPVPADLTPTAVLDQMRLAIHLYADMLGENPVGANFEITRALNGANPRHVQFIRPEAGLRINHKGELVDAWGTPFFFHQLSARQMEIRSAGPDRILWTSDDLVVR